MEFNNREIAVIIILGIIIVPLLFNYKIRESFVKLFFDGKLHLIFELNLVYILCSLIFLTSINFWDFALLKGTLLWIIFTSYALMLNVNKLSNEEGFLKSIIVANFKVIVLLEFISNLFVFSLVPELILQAILLLLGILIVISSKDPKLEKFHNFLNIVFGVFGISIFAYTLFMLIKNYEVLFTVDTFRELFLPIVLTILYLPFIYILALYIKYEVYFVRLDHINKGNPLNTYAKFKLLLSLNIRLRKLVKFTRKYPVIRYESKEEINNLIKKAV